MAKNVVAEASVRITADSSGVKKASEESKSELQGIAKAGKAMGKAVAVGAVATATAIGKIGLDALKSYADYEQLVGGVETLFKDSAGAVQQYANQAYKTAGMSANQYMETVTSFSASLLSGLGGDTQAAADLGDRAMRDMSDNANKFGSDIGTIQNAYQGFAKGNYTMLDNLKLGFGGTASEMARLINETGVMGEGFVATSENMSKVPFNKIIEGIGKVQDEMGITGTTAKEASETISGSLASTQASWQNLLTGLAGGGDDLDSLVSNFIDSLGTLAENAIPVFINALGGIADAIPVLVNAILEKLPELTEKVLPPLVSGIVQIVPALFAALQQVFATIVSMLPELIPLLLDGAINLFMAFVDAIPMIITTLIEAIPKIAEAVVEAIPMIVVTISEFLKGDGIPMIIEGFITMMLAMVDAIPDIVNALVKVAPDLIGGIVIGLIKAIPRLLVGMAMVGIAMIDAFIKIFAKLNDTFVWFVDGIAGFFADIGNAIWDSIKGVLKFALGKIPVLGQKAIEFLKLKDGGSVGGQVRGAGGTRTDSVPAYLSRGEYVVNESSVRNLGTDVMDFINTNGALPSTGDNTSITVNAPQQADPLALAQQIARMSQMNVARTAM